MMLSSLIDYAGAPLYAKLCQNLDLVIFAQCSSRTWVSISCFGPFTSTCIIAILGSVDCNAKFCTVELQIIRVPSSLMMWLRSPGLIREY